MSTPGAASTDGTDGAPVPGRAVHVLHLYPQQLNTYGDRGNLISLEARLRGHGLRPAVHALNPGDDLPEHVDVVLGGGGEDRAQVDVADDLMRLGPRLAELVAEGVPMILVCGSYQLFGTSYQTRAGAVLPGIGVFRAATTAAEGRLVGNVVATAPGGALVGFENHGGRTELAPGQDALAEVVRGSGNGTDRREGARTVNAIGTYLHGPVLALNPWLTDEVVRLAALRAHGTFTPRPIDDRWADAARAAAYKRPVRT